MEKGERFKSPQHEIEALESKVLEKREQDPSRSIRDIVKEELEGHTKYMVPRPTETVPQSEPKTDVSKEISFLVQSAFKEGIIKAAAKAYATHNPYLIDAFHDALRDEYIADLKARGIIEPHE
jgi:hypothetical protein